MSYHRGFNRGGGVGMRRLVMFAGIAFLLIMVWIIGVFAFGGGGGDGAADPEQGEQEQPSGGSTNPESTRGAEDVPEGTVLEAGDDDPEAITADDPEEAEREKREEQGTTPEGGAEQEPGGHDPLGNEASSGDLTQRDQSRVRAAAAKFVTAAYGYSGEDPDEYNQEVGETVIWPEFFNSEGSREIERYAGQVEDSGTESAATLEEFDVEDSTGEPGREVIEGYAYFATADTYNDYGEIEGERAEYRQSLTIIRQQAIFKVEAAGPIEERDSS